MIDADGAMDYGYYLAKLCHGCPPCFTGDGNMITQDELENLADEFIKPPFTQSTGDACDIVFKDKNDRQG